MIKDKVKITSLKMHDLHNVLSKKWVIFLLLQTKYTNELLLLYLCDLNPKNGSLNGTSESKKVLNGWY